MLFFDRGVFLLSRLRVALEHLDNLVTRPGVLGLHRFLVDLELGCEPFRPLAIFGLLTLDALAESQLDVRLRLGAGRDQGLEVG